MCECTLKVNSSKITLDVARKSAQVLAEMPKKLPKQRDSEVNFIVRYAQPQRGANENTSVINMTNDQSKTD